MTRAKNFWLLGLLSASCVVNGFTIEDQLPGSGGQAGGGDAGSNAAGTPPSTQAGSSSQAGNGAAGAVTQGGRPGTAGAQGDAGSPVADAGEPSVGQGGGAGGEGGAPAGPLAPCDPSNGKPPLLCDDFESGLFKQLWSPPAGIGVTTATGRSGPTKLVHLDGAQLETKLSDLPITAAGGQVTISFWAKVPTVHAGAPILSLRDRGNPANTIRLTVIQKELGWKSSGSNFSVPELPTTAMFEVGVWTCVSVRFAYSSIVLSYQSQGAATVSTLTIDNVATTGVDANWQNLSADARYAAGPPVFGGAFQGIPGDLDIDDVRVAADTSSVCPF